MLFRERRVVLEMFLGHLSPTTTLWKDSAEVCSHQFLFPASCPACCSDAADGQSNCIPRLPHRLYARLDADTGAIRGVQFLPQLLSWGMLCKADAISHLTSSLLLFLCFVPTKVCRAAEHGGGVVSVWRPGDAFHGAGAAVVDVLRQCVRQHHEHHLGPAHGMRRTDVLLLCHRHYRHDLLGGADADCVQWSAERRLRDLALHHAVVRRQPASCG